MNHTMMKSSARAAGLLLTTFTLLLLLGPFTPAGAAVRYAQSGGPGSGVCTAWATACNLQQALAAASAGDEIWVKSGAYLPTGGSDRSVSFVLKEGVALYGGFGGSEALRSDRPATGNVTTLSGDIGAPGQAADNSYHVVIANGVSGATILDRFTISNGSADGAGLHGDGGGIRMVNGSPTLSNLVITANSALMDGGGIYNEGGSPFLTNSTINNNAAGLEGGGMYNLTAAPALTNVIVSGNQAGLEGGGIYSLLCSPRLTNVTLAGNTAVLDGNSVYGICAPACSGPACLFTITGDTNPTGPFNLDSFIVTPSAGQYGSITPTGGPTVIAGTPAAFSIIPAAGHHVITPVGGTCPIGAFNGITYTTAAITANCTVDATFDIIVTPSAGAGGTISPSSVQSLTSGSSAVFTITPSQGYRVAATIGGTCGGSYSGDPYDFTNGVTYTTGAVSGDCTVAPEFTPIACGPRPSGLMAWWRAEGNPDSSVGGYTGTATNVSYDTGKVNQAFSFSGSNSYVTITDNGALDFTGKPFAISAWVKITGAFTGDQGYGTIFDRIGNSGGYRLDYAPSSNTIRLLGLGTSLIGNSAVQMNNNTWYNVSAVADGAENATIYINGVAALSGPYSAGTGSEPYVTPRIGECQNISGAPFNGLIDEVQIFNRALSAADIQAIYGAGSAGVCSGGYNVTIGATSANGGWSGDTPDVWVPTASGSTVAASEILSRLTGGSGVTVTTAGGGSENGDLTVTLPISWSANALNLSATRNINIDSVLTASDSSTLALTATGGAVKTALGGKVNFDRNGSGLLTINGASYSVINDVTALQAISGALSGNYALGADIDASDTASWNSNAGFLPLGDATTQFTGVFDGLGHTISGLTINRPATDYVGLFGSTSGANLRNVGLVGGSVSGHSYVGGLVGQNSGTIQNAYTATAIFGASQYSGGLVGNNMGPLSEVYSSGAVRGGSSYNSGGLAGANSSSISNAYSSGNVTVSGTNTANFAGGLVGQNTGPVSNCYSTGSVSGYFNVGGLVGLNESGGSVSNSFWDATVNAALADNGFGTAKTTAEMKALATFSGWDVSATGGAGKTWRIYEGQSYPLLRGFLAPLTVTAADTTKVYDGSAYSGDNDVSYTPAGYDASKLLGAPAYGGDSRTATSGGSFTIIPGGLYSGQDGYDISYVNGTLTISKAATTTAVSSSAASSVYGNPVTFTATVGIVVGTPTGTVTFYDGAAIMGTRILDGSWQAAFSISTPAMGIHAVTAVYGGDSSFAASTSASIDQTVTWIPPTATAATSISATGFTANWGSVTGATTGYYLDVATDSGFTSFATGYNNKYVGDVITCAVTGLASGTPYFYRVRSYNSGGASNSSNTITALTLPGAATTTAATSVTATGFTANWNAVTGATGYFLDVATDSGFTTPVNGYGNKDVGNVAASAVSGLTVNNTYYYRVRAYNSSGSGATSNFITVLIVPFYTLTLTISGNGGGSVTSTSPSFSCNTGCTQQVAASTPLALTAAPAEFSLPGEWSVSGSVFCDSVNGAVCNMTMNNDRTVGIAFTRDTAHTARIDGATPVYYPILQQAYAAAATGNVIEVWGIDLGAGLTCGAATTVTIRGGYDQPYLNRSGLTSLHSLTIGKGTVTVDGIVVK